ncbi:unnamed protein product [Heligmosomoides polygyrus]|uniref:COesterase domain-containing protein n=1 Tax=Heligmosomoides polygyrus TaxID=6339 RepID=A0A183GEG1_HELPZ|nr:unnamed protein product [Heligmosomoides polygyrus]
MVGDVQMCEGLQFTETFVGEDATFCPPEDYPVNREDQLLFEQSLRMCTIYVSPDIKYQTFVNRLFVFQNHLPVW